MEALVLAGLLGAGYLINKEEEDKNPITTPAKKEITVPNGENIYNSEHYNETDNLVRSLAKKNFESSQLPESRVVNHQKLEPVASNEEEVDNYETNLTAVASTYSPNDLLNLKLTSSFFRTKEQEFYDILGEYWLGELDNNIGSDQLGEVVFNRGVGSYMNHARNVFKANVGARIKLLLFTL